MPRDPDCVFCKIAAGEIPALAVYDSATVLAFLDIGPLAEGHLLVIPKEHYAHLVDMPEEACAGLMATLPRLGRALLTVSGAAGFNVLQNNGRVAGQVVDHVHVHLIPRTGGDGLGYRWQSGEYATGRGEEIVRSYKSALAQTPD